MAEAAVHTAGEIEAVRRAANRRLLQQEQRIVAREAAADGKQAKQVAQVGQHGFIQIRRAECSAAMPPLRSRTATLRKPAAVIISANRSWFGKRRMLSTR